MTLPHRTTEPHDHCWHDRSYRGEHMDFVAEYQQCCRCDLTPAQAKAAEGDTDE